MQGLEMWKDCSGGIGGFFIVLDAELTGSSSFQAKGKFSLQFKEQEEASQLLHPCTLTPLQVTAH